MEDVRKGKEGGDIRGGGGGGCRGKEILN